MKALSGSILAMLILGPLAATAQPDTSAGYDNAIEKYVQFVADQKTASADYILNLFQHYDVVVLCERSHPETTQYDLIYQIASDPRFQKDSGAIFTEVGSTAMLVYIQSLLLDERLSSAQINDRLKYIAKNLNTAPVWDKTNFYDFLRKLHQLNCSLPMEQRVHVYPSDMEFRWQTIKPRQLQAFNKSLDGRDKVMAENILVQFDGLRKGPRKKALVIMNYRHAFPHLKDVKENQMHENTCGYLMAALPGQVANVMINSLLTSEPPRGTVIKFTPMQDGKWDAAFAALKNPDVGFDFKGSPFGADSFDYFPYFQTGLRYQDVFTGFVFYKPLSEHRFSFGLPGLIDRSFTEELFRRFRLSGVATNKDDAIRAIKNLSTATLYSYDAKSVSTGGMAQTISFQSDCTQQIQKWLKPNP